MTMFRLYLMNRLKDGLEDTEGRNPRGYIDRRKYQRFGVEDKKVLISNEEDLLSIQNISREGFFAHTNERTFDRLTPGDIYKSKVRYRGESYGCNVKVRWKDDLGVGFSIENPDSSIKNFLARLILPQKIASSLKEVTEEKIIQELGSHCKWFLGKHDTHIITYRIGAKIKWLIKTKEFVLFHNTRELSATIEERILNAEIIKYFFSESSELKPFNPKKDHIILCEDIIMASSLEAREAILEGLSENNYSEVRIFKAKH